MRPNEHQEAKELFGKVLDLEPHHRALILDEACAGRPHLRHEVESLLVAYQKAGTFIDVPAVALPLSPEGVRTAAAEIMVGQRLGPYEIGSLLGSGGMGDVYRARDTKLARDVAIKILPDLFIADPERRARFEREARVLAALNHPHIAAIYGLEDRDAIHGLVLELVEGSSLADHLRAGPLALHEALTIARQIADALEAAHEKGIVHRDLKPANISITHDGVVKVLDFGLAKAGYGGRAGEPGGVDDALSRSPTVTVGGTRDGVILGTAAYMSPEQARGKAVDKKTDIWAFGCLLYEMLTGRRAFVGETVSDTIAAILDREPAWDVLPAATPANARRLLRRCLEKDPKQRLHDVADARIEIDDALQDPAPSIAAGARPPLRPLRVALWMLSAVTAVGLMAAFGLRFATTPTSGGGVARFAIALPPKVNLEDMALSPDGRTLVFSGGDGTTTRLYKRTLESLEWLPIRGTEGADRPFFSPDGASIGFMDAETRAIKRVPLSGGAPQTVYEVGFAIDATWLADDTIVFGSASGLMRVPASGGEVRQITVVDRARGEFEHHSPVALPGGGAMLFTVYSGARDDQHIDAVSLPSGKRVSVARGSGAQFVPTGHIAFAFQRTDSLWAAPFDKNELRLTGPPTPVVEGITISGGWIPTIGVSANGSLAYAINRSLSSVRGSYAPRQLVWVDRAGHEEPVDAPSRAWYWPQIAPDGKRLGFHIMDPNNMDAWIYELDHGPLVRMTWNRAQDGYPLWSPDGKRIAFWSRQGGGLADLYIRSADLTGSDERLTTSSNIQLPFSWSRDGKLLVFQEYSPNTKMDIGMVPVDGEHRPTMLLQGPFDEGHPAVSPNGRWIAYQSNVSGRWEVYVQPFPELGNRWQVSTQGGVSPIWEPNGRELFYRTARAVMSIPVTADGNTFRYGNSQALFDGPYVPESASSYDADSYALSPDGRRFLMIKEDARRDGNSGPPEIVVVLNWAQELKRIAAGAVK